MAAKLIPGPYVFNVDESSIEHAESGMIIAQISSVDDYPCRDSEKDDEFEAELEATGNLLAAAPDLLVQLKGMLGLARFIINAADLDTEATTVVLRNRGETVAEVPVDVLLTNTEAAIAKAEGR